MGWDVINMTQYPESYLARELGICYANISLITDYDAGLEGRDDIAPLPKRLYSKCLKKTTKRLRKCL